MNRNILSGSPLPEKKKEAATTQPPFLIHRNVTRNYTSNQSVPGTDRLKDPVHQSCLHDS